MEVSCTREIRRVNRIQNSIKRSEFTGDRSACVPLFILLIAKMIESRKESFYKMTWLDDMKMETKDAS